MRNIVKSSQHFFVITLLSLCFLPACSYPTPKFSEQAPVLTPTLQTQLLQEAAHLPTPSGTPQVIEQPVHVSTPFDESSATSAAALSIQAPTISSVNVTSTVTPRANSGTSNPEPTTTRYRIFALLDYGGHNAEVSQTITYVNNASVTIDDLLFVVEPNRDPSAFHLVSLFWANGVPIDEYSLHGVQLRIPLLKPLNPGDTVSLSMNFTMNIPEVAAPFGYTERQSNLGDWYPRLPPYDSDRGWLVHEPAVVGEHLLYDVADYDVTISLADHVDDLVVAASSPSQIDGNRYNFQLKSARSFALSLSTEYQVLSSSINSITVTSYFFPEDYLAGAASLQATMDALEVFSERLSSYPHASLSIVEAAFADGMEYDGLYFLDQDLYKTYSGDVRSYLTTIAAHETAHQWWYGIIANDQALEPWLDEALATYSELLVYETKYPDSVAWWWDVRVRRYSSDLPINGSIYDYDGFRSYVDTVYLRGTLFLDEIRQLLGDSLFFLFLQEYIAESYHQFVTAEDFWAALAEHGLGDQVPLKTSYFERSN